MQIHIGVRQWQTKSIVLKRLALPASATRTLEVLLEPDDAPYPWNNADPESDNYFVEAEQEFVEDWLTEQ